MTPKRPRESFQFYIRPLPGGIYCISNLFPSLCPVLSLPLFFSPSALCFVYNRFPLRGRRLNSALNPEPIRAGHSAATTNQRGGRKRLANEKRAGLRRRQT